MSRFMCNGKGVEVGSKVAVRERSDFSDGGFYCGTVLNIVPDKKDRNRDVVYVESWKNCCVYSTFRHCCYATSDNAKKLVSEVGRILKNTKDHINTLSASIGGLSEYAHTANRKHLISLEEQVALSDKIDKIKCRVAELCELCNDLGYFAEDLEYVLSEITKKEKENMKKKEVKKEVKEKSVTYATLRFHMDDETYLEFLTMLEDHPEFEFDIVEVEHEYFKEEKVN